MDSSLLSVLEITSRYIANRGHPHPDFSLSPQSAVCQDAYIFGIDVDDYVHELEEAFGPVVRQIPWLRFTDQAGSFRGFGCLLVPFWLMTRLVLWPFRRGKVMPRVNPKAFGPRLEMQHIAKVIDTGHWLEP